MKAYRLNNIIHNAYIGFVLIIITSAESRAIAITFGVSLKGFPAISPAKKQRIQTKLGRKKLRQKGNLQKNLGADRLRGAPTR